MSYQRIQAEFKHYPKTKSITVLVEYKGEIKEDSAIAKESIALLIGDSWWEYCNGLGLDPVLTMKMIDELVRKQRGL